MTVRVDMSQTPVRVTVTTTLGDLRGGSVPQFLLQFGGNGRADVVVEPDAPLEMVTRLRAAVLIVLLEAEALADSRRRIFATGQGSALPVSEPVRALLRAV